MSFMIIIQIVFAIIFIAAGVNLLRKQLSNKKNNTASTMAEVVDYISETTRDSDNLPSTAFFPVVTYSVQGKDYREKYEVGTGTMMYKVGSQIQINYNPNNPTKFNIANDKASYFGAYGTIALGVGLIIYTIISLLME